LTLFYIIKNLYLPQNKFLATPMPLILTVTPQRSIGGWPKVTPILAKVTPGYAVTRLYTTVHACLNRLDSCTQWSSNESAQRTFSTNTTSLAYWYV